MEDNRKFATFFADAPKGKKIGAVLSWIATVILLVALFVPGYQLRYQIKTEKGTFKDIPATMTSELKQMKEAAKLNFQFGAGTTSDKIDEFVEKGSTSVFSYLVSHDLQKARLVNLGTMSDAPDDISKICVALLVLFLVLVVAAAVASVFTISWCALAANLIGIIELLAVYFFVFAGKFSIDPTDTSITSRVAPALTMILIVLLVLAAIMSVASVIVSYVVHGQHPKGGSAVQQNIVIVLLCTVQDLLQHFFPAHGIDKGNFQPCQLNVGRDEVYTLCMVQHTFTGRNALVVHGFCHQGRKSGGQFIGLLPAHTDGERTLWVSIHQ